MFDKKRIVVAGVFIIFMFMFITFAGGTPQNQAIATRNVTFIDGYSNQEISSQRVIVGEDAEVPEDPNHDAMVFSGWYLESDRDRRITDFTNITEDITVIARYSADRNRNGVADEQDATYTVRFVDSIDNTVLSTQQVLVGMAAVSPTVRTHAGYTFVGFDRSFSNVRENITVRTVYREDAALVNRYTVSFRDGLTDEIFATVEVEEGLTVALPEVPRHEGYTFVRFEGDLDNIQSDSTITIIYAVDENGNDIADDDEIHYTVSYVALLDGATGEAPRYDSAFLTGATYTVLENTFKLEDAVFIGWTTNMDDAKELVTSKTMENGIDLIKEGSKKTIANEDVVYYAVFAKNANGNTGDTTPDYDEAQYKLTYVIDGKEDIVSNHVKGEIITLMDGDNLSSDEKKFIGWSTTQWPILTKKNHADEDKIVILDEVEFDSEDITVYAVFAKVNSTTGDLEYLEDQYRVTYDKGLDEATGKVEDENVYVEGDEYTLLENEYELKDAVFLGWSLNDPGKIIETLLERDDLELVAPKTKGVMVEGGVTYYAVFANDKNGDGTPDYEENQYKLTYVIDGDENNNRVSSHVSGEIVSLDNGDDLSTDSIKFIGWSKDAWPLLTKENYEDRDDIITIDKAVFLNEDITVYAVYAKVNEKTGELEYLEDQYRVTYDKGFDAATGKTEDENVYVIGDEYTLLENGYILDKAIFIGWSEENPSKIITSQDEEDKILFMDMTSTYEIVEGGSKYYAVWAQDENGNGVKDYDVDKDIRYTVSYESLIPNTTGSVASEEVLNGLSYTVKKNAYEVLNAVFIGWTTEKEKASSLIEKNTLEEAATLIKPNTKVNDIRENITYYAVFATDTNGNGVPDGEELIVVTYEASDKGNVKLSKTREELMPGTTIEFPTITIDKGYDYAWYEGDKLVTSATVKEGETSRAFTLKVTEIDYTLTFIYEKNRVQKSTDRHYGEAINAPTVGDYRDLENKYIFKGWSITGEDAIVDVSLMTVTGDMSFTAKYETRRLPKLTATSSTGNWTKDDVTITLNPSSYTTVTKYEYKLNSGEWTTIDVENNRFTATKKESYQFRITDQNGEVAVSNLVNVKIDRTRPVITSPVNGTSISANGNSEVNLELNVAETESGLKNGIVYYLPGEYKTVSEFKKELAKVDEKPTVTINNGKGTVELIFDGKYTFYAIDNVGNEVEKPTVINISGIKENGITDNDKVETSLTSVNMTIYKTKYGSDGWIFWQTRPYRDVLVTPKTGFTVLEVKWDVGNKTKEYFRTNGNVESANKNFTLKNPSTRRSTRYTVYVKSVDNSTGEIIEETQVIYATGHILGFRY